MGGLGGETPQIENIKHVFKSDRVGEDSTYPGDAVLGNRTGKRCSWKQHNFWADIPTTLARHFWESSKGNHRS